MGQLVVVGEEEAGRSWGSEERTGVVDVGEVGQCPYAADRGAAMRPCACPECIGLSRAKA